MNDRAIVEVGKGPSLATLLLILFITLKLTGIISWSWWWVLSPVWISVGIVAIVVVIIGTMVYLKEK